MNPTEAIDEVLRIGRAHNHEFERLPYSFVQQLLDMTTEQDGIPAPGAGLLTLLIGVANWGVDWAPKPGWQDNGPEPADPAGHDWEGRPKRSGKHLLDGTHAAPYGGLHLPHWDSGALADWYEKWSRPTGGGPYIVGRKPLDFNSILRVEHSREHWLDWSTGLLNWHAGNASVYEVHHWSIRKWLREYWAVAYKRTCVACRWEGGPIQQVPFLREAVINTRIMNSAKGWAKRWAQKLAEDQAHLYITSKRAKRGDSAGKRAERQVSFVKRVWTLLDAE